MAYKSPALSSILSENSFNKVAKNMSFYYNDNGEAKELWNAFKNHAFFGIPENDIEGGKAFKKAKETYIKTIKNFFTFLENHSFEQNKFLNSKHSGQRQAIFTAFMSSDENEETRATINRFHNILLTIFDELLETFKVLGALLAQQAKGIEMFVDLSGEVVQELNASDVQVRKVAVPKNNDDYTGKKKKAEDEFANSRASEKKTKIDTARSRVDRMRDRKSSESEGTTTARNDQIQILASIINKFESLLQAIMK